MTTSRNPALYVLGLSLFVCGWAAQGGTIRAASASRADVCAAVASARDGDIVIIPAGSAIWKTPLSITKNISLIGADEEQTVITADLPVSTSPPLLKASLSH